MPEPLVDLVLVNPGDRIQTYQSLGQSLSAVEPPVWAGLMATFVRTHGHSVRILDANAEQLTPEQAAVRIDEMQPRLVGVVVYGHNPSASTQVMPSAGAICWAIKELRPEQKVILLGGHVTALPERTLTEERVDFVSPGEGLHTLADLVTALKAQPFEPHKVRDLMYLEDGKVQRTPPAALLKDLDTFMPQMAWDLLPMELYRAHNWHCFDGLERQPYAAVYTTLGCPYKCTFCCIQAPFKSGERVIGLRESTNSYRFWSTKNVLDQIGVLVEKYGVRNIKFADEMFVLNKKHVIAVCDGIVERGYDLNIWAYARVDTVKDGMLDKLKAAGFSWLGFGIEAASSKVRQDVQKDYSEDDIMDVLEKVRKAGIHIGANYIFGLPEDDTATMQETLDLALSVNSEYANFYCTMAYPGSQLYAMALAKGLRLPESWAGYSQHSEDTLPLPTRHLSGEDVLGFRDQAFQKYFTSPAYLSMMERKFGKETRAHVEEMTKKRLVRRHYPRGTL